MAILKNELNKFEKTFIGESPEIKNLISSVKKISKTLSATTLITGESGTGKELIARLVHNLSTFADQPFVNVHCGAIPESLLESELFGYEKGAFTGAHIRKKGLFELADRGSIFLDEISNTTANFQIKLLKVVENKRFRRVGGTEEVNIATRIIAATNIDLIEAVEKDKFRKDLYYRLNVCQLCIPPLRNRKNDAHILARYFIERFNKEHACQVRGLAPSAIKLIKEYHWPGNVRQLKNAIERAVLIGCKEWIKAEHILIHSERDWPDHSKGDRIPQYQSGDNTDRIEVPDAGISLEAVEKNLIQSALDKAKGNLCQAARLLKISRGKLRYRLKKMKIQ